MSLSLQQNTFLSSLSLSFLFYDSNQMLPKSFKIRLTTFDMDRPFGPLKLNFKQFGLDKDDF
jgi:hypothetical protein